MKGRDYDKVVALIASYKGEDCLPQVIATFPHLEAAMLSSIHAQEVQKRVKRSYYHYSQSSKIKKIYNKFFEAVGRGEGPGILIDMARYYNFSAAMLAKLVLEQFMLVRGLETESVGSATDIVASRENSYNEPSQQVTAFTQRLLNESHNPSQVPNVEELDFSEARNIERLDFSEAQNVESITLSEARNVESLIFSEARNGESLNFSEARNVANISPTPPQQHQSLVVMSEDGKDTNTASGSYSNKSRLSVEFSGVRMSPVNEMCESQESFYFADEQDVKKRTLLVEEEINQLTNKIPQLDIDDSASLNDDETDSKSLDNVNLDTTQKAIDKTCRDDKSIEKDESQLYKSTKSADNSNGICVADNESAATWINSVDYNASKTSIVNANLVDQSSTNGHKSRLNKLFRDTSLIPDKALSFEIHMCLIHDDVYGPFADTIKHSIGHEYEVLLCRKLEELGIGYQTEDDLRVMGCDKTPDVKLHVPIGVNGRVVNWIESKASFGDRDSNKGYLKEQFWSYWNRFGPGLVIYWFGFIDDLNNLGEKGIMLMDTFPTNIIKMDSLSPDKLEGK